MFIETRSTYRADRPEELRPVGEVEFVQGLAAASTTGLYGLGRAAAAIVGYADLKLGDRVQPVLEALQAASPNRFRGIRHAVGWNAYSGLAKRDTQGALSIDGYRAGASILAKMGLTLDNSLYFHQLYELVDFARAVPDLTIVLNQIGGLLRIGLYANRDDEMLAEWRKAVAAAAQCPNIVIKLGGVGQRRYGFDWHKRNEPIGSEELAEYLAPLMTYCFEQCGPERCMFESNFPWTRFLIRTISVPCLETPVQILLAQ